MNDDNPSTFYLSRVQPWKQLDGHLPIILFINFLLYATWDDGYSTGVCQKWPRNESRAKSSKKDLAVSIDTVLLLKPVSKIIGFIDYSLITIGFT